MSDDKVPVTVEIEGRDEPIKAAKIAFGKHGNDIMAHILTPEGKIATVKNDKILVYWNNVPMPEDLDHIDRMIREGNEKAKDDSDKQTGVEVQ